MLAMFVLASCAALASSGNASNSRRLVKLTIVAIDSKGAPVTDLRPEEIQLREDGSLRSMAYFRFAGSSRALAALAPDEFENRPGPPPTLILLDRWNEGLSTMAKAWHDVDEALLHAESVQRIYVYLLTGRGELWPVRPVPGAAEAWRPVEPPSPAELVAKLDDAVRQTEGLRLQDRLDPVQRSYTTWQALGIFRKMDPMAGRKNFIWVTHGVPLYADALDGARADFTRPIVDLANAQAGSQVAIYTVAQAGEGPQADPSEETRQALRLFSDITGGRAYPSDYTRTALTEALNDGRGAYQVAYYSPVLERGSWEHKIRVDAVRKGVRLLTRGRYYGDEVAAAPDELADSAFEGLTRSPFDATEIALRVRKTRIPGRDAVHFEVVVDPRDLLMERDGGQFRGSFTLRLALYGKAGFIGVAQAVQKDFTLTDFTLTQEQRDDVKNGIGVSQDVVLDRDIQQVRLMVFDWGLRTLGSVTIPVR